jgi:quinol-cytochrome oxidoreductase complex cytochrome b subunit
MISFMPTLFLPEAANTPADPLKTPLRIKPEWYFLAPYQMLRIIPNNAGINLQVLISCFHDLAVSGHKEKQYSQTCSYCFISNSIGHG